MTNDVMPFISGDMPAHLNNSGELGNENVSANDLATPRILLLQAISPQCKRSTADYIPGAEEGKFLNTVTQELSDSILCINLYFDKEFLIWRKRKSGGGKIGSFPTQTQAWSYIRQNGLDDNDYDVVETDNHYLLLLNKDGSVRGPAVINMSSTKLRTSRLWNTDINQKSVEFNAARFAGVWELTSKNQTYKENSWAGLEVKFMGWVQSAELFEEANKLYHAIATERAQTTQPVEAVEAVDAAV